MARDDLCRHCQTDMWSHLTSFFPLLPRRHNVKCPQKWLTRANRAGVSGDLLEQSYIFDSALGAVPSKCLHALDRHSTSMTCFWSAERRRNSSWSVSDTAFQSLFLVQTQVLLRDSNQLKDEKCMTLQVLNLFLFFSR